MVLSLSLAQGELREMVFWMMFMIPALAGFSCCPPSCSLKSHGWLIMEQSCCPLNCMCHMSCSKPPLPQLWWIICDRVTGAHGHSCPWLCLANASAESIACPRKEKGGQQDVADCWLPSLSLAAQRDKACMGGPVWGCLLLIELLTQPLALGDTSVSLPMINLNFIHSPGLLPDLVRPRSMCWDTHNKRAKRGKEKWWGEGQGKIWWWWQNKSTH